MHIRFLEMSTYGAGGVSRTVANQADALVGAGHDVEVVSLYRRGYEPTFPLDRRVRVTDLVTACERVRSWYGRPGPHTAWRSRLVPRDESRYGNYSELTDARLTALVRGTRGGVLVCTRPSFALIAARYAPDDVVVVAQDHMHLASRRPGVHAAMRRWYPRLDAVTVLTEADRQAYHRVLRLPGLRVERVPNATPVDDRCRSRLRNHVAVAAGRLTRQKGFDRLIRAWRAVASAHPDWELHVFGRGPKEPQLQAQIAAAGLDGRVRLLGVTRHLDRELAGASMFVLSSRFEGFPMVVLEAMSHGLPVVAYDCPTGPAEMITHGRDGLLVPGGDVRGLAEAIGSVIDDEALRSRLGTAASSSVRRFGTGPITARWEELFEDLLARRASRRRRVLARYVR